MPILDRKFMEETQADKMADMFPYLHDRFDALHEIRKTNESDLARMTSFGRSMAKQGKLGRRIASIPYHVIAHWHKTYGHGLLTDIKLFRAWLAQNPEYKA